MVVNRAISALRRYLGRPKVIKLQLLLLLVISRIHHSVEKYYKKYYADDRVIKELKLENGLWPLLETSPSMINVGNPTANCRKSNRFQGVKPILEIPSKLRWYNCFSTSWMIYCVVKRTLILDKLVALFQPKLPAHCYILSRFIFTDELHNQAGVLISLFHLSWRFSQKFLSKCQNLSAATFMMQDEDDLNRFYGLMNAKHCYNSLYNVQLDINEHFLRQTLCYRVKIETGINASNAYVYTIYRLRPNRTIEARRKLFSYIAKVTTIFVFAFSSMTILITLNVTCQICSDVKYLSRYPGCFISLEERHKRGELKWYSVTPTGHHLISGLIDGVENFILWWDSGAALTFVMTLVYVLNYDLLAYCDSLSKKLQLELWKAKMNWIDNYSFESFDDDKPLNDPYLDVERYQLMNRRVYQEKVQIVKGPSTIYPIHRPLHKLPFVPTDGTILVLQSELSDFFWQIGKVNLFMTDFLSACIFMWFITVAVVNYYAFGRTVGSVPVEVRLIQLFGFLILTFLSVSLLELRRSTMKLYPLICSLMSYDRSKYKYGFMKVLEFYTSRNRTTYTLFRQFPYSSTTYLSIIGWTLSCFFIIDNLFRKR